MKSRIVFRKDTRQTKALVKSAKVGSRRAFSASKALGLSISYIKDGVVYEESSDGCVVAKQQLEVKEEAPFKLIKGLILHAK